VDKSIRGLMVDKSIKYSYHLGMYDSIDSILAEGAENNDIFFKEKLKNAQRNVSKLSASDRNKLFEYMSASEDIQYRMRRESLDVIKEYKRNIQRMTDLIEKEEIKKEIELLKVKNIKTIFYSVNKKQISFHLGNDIANTVTFTGNRKKYLEQIISDSSKDKTTPGQLLLKLANHKDISNVSTAISEINKRFEKVLAIKEVIRKNTGGNGYTLNQLYEFILQ
jgi:hypothetical protein